MSEQTAIVITIDELQEAYAEWNERFKNNPEDFAEYSEFESESELAQAQAEYLWNLLIEETNK